MSLLNYEHDISSRNDILNKRISAKGLTSTVTSYIAQVVTHVEGFLFNKQLSSDHLKKLIGKTERKIKEIYDKLHNKIKAFQENKVQAYKHCSAEDLIKAVTELKEYSGKLKDVLNELIKRIQNFKNKIKIRIMTYAKVRSVVIYLENKITETRKLTQDMITNIKETIKDSELNRKLVTIAETNYGKVEGSVDDLYIAIKKTTIIEEHECIKSESTYGKSFKSKTMSYMERIITYVSGFTAGKKMSDTQMKMPIFLDVKNLVNVTEVKIKELYDGILTKVKDLHEIELPTCKNSSREKSAKIKSNLQEYCIKIWRLSEDMLKRLKVLKNELQTRIITHEEFQTLALYFERKIIETKKLTEDMVKFIQVIVNKPILEKKLKTVVEISSQKVKIAMDDLYTAIEKNISKVGQHKSLSDNKRFYSDLLTFGKMRTSIKCLSELLSSSNDSQAVATNFRGNSIVGFNKEKLPFIKLSNHFNSRTIYGRANVAKAMYAGILIYYIYRNVKNTST